MAHLLIIPTVISDSIIIPADKVGSIKGSVYDHMINHHIICDGNKVTINGGGIGNISGFARDYLEESFSEYQNIISEGYDLIHNLMKNITSTKKVTDKLAETLFKSIGFVKVYRELKTNQVEISKELKDIFSDKLDDIYAKYPQLKNKNSADDVIECIIDSITVDNTGKLAVNVDNINPDIIKSLSEEEVLATIENTTAPSIRSLTKPLPAAPVDSEPPPLTRAFVPDGAGNVDINLTNIVMGQVDIPPVDAAPDPTVTVAPQPTETVTPPPTNMSNHPKEVQTEVKVKKDKGDLKDVKSPEVSSPSLGVVPMTEDQKKEFISHNPALAVVENKLGTVFKSVYRIDSNFVYIDIYAADKPDTKIDWMSMTVDLSGHVFGKTPKFWPGSDNKEPVDFMPALHLTDEAISAYWSEEEVPDKCYYAVKNTAELNRKIDISSIFANTADINEVPAVIKVLTNEVFKSTKVKNKLKDGRLRVTSYVSPQEFTLAPMADVHKYVGGPLANNDVIMFNVTVKGGKVVSVA